MRYKHSILSVVIIIVAGIAAWSTLSYHPQNLSSMQKISVPDAFMENVVAIVMDKQGKVSMKIATPKMIHYAENDTTYLTRPELTIHRRSPQPWYITSEYAKATNGADKVDFWENVTIHHAADTNNPTTMIKTSKLTVLTQDQIADTSELITLTQPNIMVNATGMHADLNSGDIKLLSQARLEYAPT